MHNRSLISALIAFPLVLAAASGDQIAFLKGGHLFVADRDGLNLRQVENDARPKSMLRWDASRKRLSYFVPRENGEKARLVIVDLNGRQLADVVIRPETKPPNGFMRFVEEADWLPDGKIRLSGSINPSNCEMFDLDVDTGTESSVQYGYCGSFAPFPDRKHIAELSPVSLGPEEGRFQVLQLDNIERFYVGDSRGCFIPAGPVWSPDGLFLAILEKRAATGEAAVTILTLSGSATRIPVPAIVLDHPSIAWIGSKVVVGDGVSAIQADPTTRQISGVTSDVADEIQRRVASQNAGETARKQIDDLVRQWQGKEGVLLAEHPQ